MTDLIDWILDRGASRDELGEAVMTAVISTCGTYRYSLSRTWDPERHKVLWIMLNPSTADAEVDDPTIRRCIGFARSWGAGGIVVANLYALRSTDPKGLWKHPEPVGPENDSTIARLLDRVDVHQIVAAWGVNAGAGRAWRVRSLVRDHGRPLSVLGFTAKGAPRHPLYVRGDVQPTAWATS